MRLLPTNGIRTALLGVLLVSAGLLGAHPAHAHAADREKPIQIEADRASLDQPKGLTVYEGNVVVTQGTILLRAARAQVVQDKAGNQQAIAHGSPATFRQKIEGKNEWLDAQGKRVEFDSAKNTVQLFDNARLKRGEDIVMGAHIVYNTRDETYQVNGGGGTAGTTTGKDGNKGRVTVILQPKKKDQP